MTDDTARGIIGKLHDAFARGDHEQFARYYDDDVDYGFVVEHARYVFDTRHRCRGEVVEYL